MESERSFRRGPTLRAYRSFLAHSARTGSGSRTRASGRFDSYAMSSWNDRSHIAAVCVVVVARRTPTHLYCQNGVKARRTPRGPAFDPSNSDPLSAETTGFPLERKHWCRCQTSRLERVTQPPLRRMADLGPVLLRGPDRSGLQDERKGWIMSVKLTDAQLVMLSAAAQREDLCLTAPEKLKGKILTKVGEKLVKLGLVREVRAKVGMPIWRRDDAGRYAVKLSSAGLKVVGVLDMLQRGGVGGEREQRLIGVAAQSTERAKTLVQRLLAFSRRQPLQPVAIDLVELVKNMAGLVSSTTGPQIRVVVEVADNLPLARADLNQLEMALLNLSVNARDAMPDGGTLRISASAETVTAGEQSGLRAGRYLCLSVADTGLGMDEATLARAVEPFFSTKGFGKGTGLGLSMVHGLASQLGGALAIKSRPGLGTNVQLWLPQSEDKVETSPAAPEAEPVRSRGMALLVDDEEAVRISTADMLADLGYGVIEATSAEEALKLIEKGAEIRLVITDHLMPGMSGADLARAVRERHPDMGLLILSGYADVDGVASDLPRLTKPFRKDELAASLAALHPSGRS
jgi:CheY-like chemotaxis protein/two-component sensor histidine kinase